MQFCSKELLKKTSGEIQTHTNGTQANDGVKKGVPYLQCKL